MAVLRALILDLGGVLIAEGEPAIRGKRELELGLGAGQLERLVTEAVGPGWVGGRSEAETHRRLAEATGIELADVGALIDDFHANAYLDPLLADYVRALRHRFKVAGLSNAGPGLRQVMVERFGLDQLLDLMVISAEERLQKPDPAIYRLTAERLGVDLEQCVFVDDREDYVKGARAVGMQAFVHRSTPATLTRLAALMGPTAQMG